MRKIDYQFRPLPYEMTKIMDYLSRPAQRIYYRLLERSDSKGWTSKIDNQFLRKECNLSSALLSSSIKELVDSGVIFREKKNKRGTINKYCIVPDKEAFEFLEEQKAKAKKKPGVFKRSLVLKEKSGVFKRSSVLGKKPEIEV